MLLNLLIKDEKKIDRELYSSGPYWNYKNRRAIIEIKKKGLKDFRGITAGIGTSFADNLVLDIRNEFNIMMLAKKTPKESYLPNSCTLLVLRILRTKTCL